MNACRWIADRLAARRRTPRFAPRPILVPFCAALSIALLTAATSHADEHAAHAAVSFQRDVMAVLSKAGCYQGACHGNQNGKGGFKLSLRGENPAADYLALTHDQQGRRVDRTDPTKSLVLVKPSLTLAHEGGLRLPAASPEYALLRQWIEAGAAPAPSDESPLVSLEVTPTQQVVIEPDSKVALSATAVFADGTRRDVRSLAVYEPSALNIAEVSHDGEVARRNFGNVTINVRYLNKQTAVRLTFIPARLDFAWRGTPPRNAFDVPVFEQLMAQRQNAAPRCDDATFVRRSFLDLTGVLPTAEEARAFVADTNLDKRERLVDSLLARPEFADHFALKWSDLLRNEEKQLDPHGVEVFHQWIRSSIASGKPLDQFVRELVTAQGSTYEHPAANFYRALRDPIQRGEAAAQVFLGTRLLCAKCHNHPFERWTQDDYYRWASVFARIDYKIVKNDRRDKFDKHEFVGEQIVFLTDNGEANYPNSKRPAAPKLLGADALADATGEQRLTALAGWLANPHNDLFVRVQANRIWRQALAIGVVEPVDDFRASNPPSNPALLDELARELVYTQFDLRAMLRRITATHVYQSASTFDAAANPLVGDDAAFARAAVRRLSAEQLLDAIHQVLDVPLGDDLPQQMRAEQITGVASVAKKKKRPPWADFLKTFGKPTRQLSCECERGEGTTLAQTFAMVSGEVVSRAIADRDNRLHRWLASDMPPEQIVDELFWTALTRPPTQQEQSAAASLLSATSNRRSALEDLAWAVLNSKEFLFRH
jgi:hypothetical protein